MKISVIVRTYKRPEFLEQALTSIQLQTHKDWEVIIFDDGDSSLNQKIVNGFKERTNNLVTYINSGKEHHLFKESWKIAPKIANGEVMIRLDDDDLLDSECLEFVSMIFSETPDLDFAYGNSVLFKGESLFQMMETKTPFDFVKSKDTWSGYIKGHPYNKPWSFTKDYFDKPKHISSIIHSSKLNQFCIFHPYMMRTKSILKVVDKITMTSNFVDDLEFLGSLDNLGLRYTSLKKVLSYVRKHDEGSITEEGKKINGVNLWDDIFRVRDEADFLRPNGTEFQSNVIKIKVPYTYNTQIDSEMKDKFGNLLSNIDNILKPNPVFRDKFDWRKF
jgi:glycosyltransferase involved in cell wall biosynthesis